MYTDLREFELAKKYMTATNQDVKELIAKQADWAMNTNDPNVAWYICTLCMYMCSADLFVLHIVICMLLLGSL